MLKRVITGACYMAGIVGFFLLRQFVDYRLFHILTYLFMIVGTIEMAMMTKPFAIKGNVICAIIFSLIVAPLYLVIEYYVKRNAGWIIAVDFIVLSAIIITSICLIKNVDKATFLSSIAPYVYPVLLLLPLLIINEMSKNAFIALLLVFVTAPLADTFAYFTGSLIGGKKLCPTLSPKKTISGAIGGLVAGVIGGIVIYFVCRPEISTFSPALTAIVFAIIGLVSAMLTIVGDLFESFIKRKVGVKDSGKILPGHGGVLDRIDGMLFASVFVCIIFLII